MMNVNSDNIVEVKSEMQPSCKLKISRESGKKEEILITVNDIITMFAFNADSYNYEFYKGKIIDIINDTSNKDNIVIQLDCSTEHGSDIHFIESCKIKYILKITE